MFVEGRSPSTLTVSHDRRFPNRKVDGGTQAVYRFISSLDQEMVTNAVEHLFYDPHRPIRNEILGDVSEMVDWDKTALRQLPWLNQENFEIEAFRLSSPILWNYLLSSIRDTEPYVYSDTCSLLPSGRQEDVAANISRSNVPFFTVANELLWLAAAEGELVGSGIRFQPSSILAIHQLSSEIGKPAADAEELLARVRLLFPEKRKTPSSEGIKSAIFYLREYGGFEQEHMLGLGFSPEDGGQNLHISIATGVKTCPAPKLTEMIYLAQGRIIATPEYGDYFVEAMTRS